MEVMAVLLLLVALWGTLLVLRVMDGGALSTELQGCEAYIANAAWMSTC